MLEFGREVALEIVFDDEDAEKIGVPTSAKDIPGESRKTKRCHGGWMKEAKGVAPAFGEKGPEKNGASAENDGGGAFGEDGKAEEEPEEKEGQPGSARKDRCVLVAREAQDHGGADHRDREHRAEGHICGGSVREANHADRRGQQEQQPAGRLRAVETQSQPSHRERCEQRRDGARQPRGGFADAEELEAKRSAPIEERGLLKPRFSVETRRDPIARLSHVACDPSVTRLIRPDEANCAQMAEVADVERRCDENGPANSGGGAGARVLGDEDGCFGHGKVSLTSKHYLPATDLLHTVARRETRAILNRP